MNTLTAERPTGVDDLQEACCKDNPEIWFHEKTMGLARHICFNHCPVFEKCSDLAPELGIYGGVIAGWYWRMPKSATSPPKISLNQPEEVLCSKCMWSTFQYRRDNIQCVACGRRSTKILCSQKCSNLWQKSAMVNAIGVELEATGGDQTTG